MEALDHLERVIEYEEKRIDEGDYDKEEEEVEKNEVDKDIAIAETGEVGDRGDVDITDDAEKQELDSAPRIVEV